MTIAMALQNRFDSGYEQEMVRANLSRGLNQPKEISRRLGLLSTARPLMGAQPQ